MASFASLDPAAGSADGQTVAEIERLAARLDRAEVATQPGQTHTAGQLPAQLVRHTPEEQRALEMKVQAGKEEGELSGFAKPQFDDRTAAYLMSKQKDAEFVDFEKWFATRFASSTDPAAAAWANKAMPSYVARRERFAKARMAMQWQLTRIMLYGPQNEEDFTFLYAIDSGKINLAELRRPVWEAPQAATAASEYRKGMFATPREAFLAAGGDVNNLLTNNGGGGLLRGLGENGGPGQRFAVGSEMGTPARVAWTQGPF